MARILVIEDNPANLQLMVYLLKAFGHEVLEAMDGEEGLALVSRDAPDLIVCDVHLPRLDGYEVCRALKSDPRYQGIPLIAVTALAMVGDRSSIMAAGFDGYLSKPIDPEKFVSEVERYLPASTPAAVPVPPVRPVRSGRLQPAEAGYYEQGAQLQPAQPAEAGYYERQRGERAERAARAEILLVLDDSVTNRALMHSIFDPHGYRLLNAGSVREAIAMLEGHVPDAILSDVHLPDRSGFDFIREVKSDPRWCEIPFLFITSTAWPEAELRQGLALGARKYLVRPIDPEALLAEVEECLQPQGSPARSAVCGT